MEITGNSVRPSGPLQGVRIIELAGMGPGPFAAMMLADMGAQIIRVERPPQGPPSQRKSAILRSRRSIAVDLKHPDGAAVIVRLLGRSDGLLEGFRPGVAERLGVGPDVALKANPALVYGRITGWGQEGPLSAAAGHDLNYIALTGALGAIGEPDRKPVPPLNLVGDFGGGGMLLAFGFVCGLLHARATGEGQVIDAAMVDGASLLMQMFFATHGEAALRGQRGTNLLDGGAPFYDVYETADGRWISLGSLEPQFYRELRERLGLDEALFDAPRDRSRWPAQRARIAEVVRRRTAADWDDALAGTDVCYAPVLSVQEAPTHPHNVHREVHIDVGGDIQAAPAPRFSVTSPSPPSPSRAVGADTREVLGSFGFPGTEIEELISRGVVATA